MKKETIQTVVVLVATVALGLLAAYLINLHSDTVGKQRAAREGDVQITDGPLPVTGVGSSSADSLQSNTTAGSASAANALPVGSAAATSPTASNLQSTDAVPLSGSNSLQGGGSLQ